MKYNAARFNFCHIEQVGNEAVQKIGRGFENIDVLALLAGGLGVESDDLEQVFGGERVGGGFGGGFGHFERQTAHGSRAIDDQHHAQDHAADAGFPEICSALG